MLQVALLPTVAWLIIRPSCSAGDPELVQLLTRQIPLYPTGVMVRLNTGEVGLVSDSNKGHIGRPTVRVCQGKDGSEEVDPYDLNLSHPEQQDRLITQVLEY